MIFDGRTLIFVCGIVLLLQSFPLVLLYGLANQYRGIGYWIIGNLQLSIGLILVSLRDEISQVLSITSANSLLILGFSFLYLGICRFTQHKVNLYFLIFINIIFALFQSYWTYIVNSFLFRVINFSLISCILCLLITFRLLKLPKGEFWASRLLTSAVFCFVGFLQIFRIIALVGGNLSTTNLFTLSFSNNIFYLSYLLSILLWTSGLVALVCQRLYQDLHKLATFDSLTGALNRQALEQALQQKFASCARHDHQSFAILLLDIDRFKEINDTYGHDAGDLALQHLVATLKDVIRLEDIFGRWGGEEFMIIIGTNDLQKAKMLGERIRSSVELSSFVYINKTIQFTVSIGIAVYKIHSCQLEELIKLADLGLYQAKMSGRNQVISIQ